MDIENSLIANHLRVCGRTFKGLEEELNKIGLYRGQPALLFILYKNNGLTQKELCSRLHIAPATITKMVKRLELSDFLERKSDEKDLRVSRIYLTPKAYEVMDSIKIIYKNFEESCFKGLSKEERDTFNNILVKINNNLKRKERR
ncbi:MarR family winged helix-turn-helix transcriptional regulator [Clostridium tetani]|uniref:MarR family transcriptional regulator n=1 Tax=Clostridium tetani TaxID=1513 RepID=A0ABY0EVN5_CLOTA|nr:MarR family transcriptional regulator [Clostridium tetani]RXI40933.1 MarR family transcriptional regulator [Clostridium tetani]RXI58650.1 MarR family transcriptional regulator [Clostridium tetani]RXI73363.1 MarR family transcriptional regulator [Clostridium tetani]CDI48483.1 transcriptional regulator [Clostridium tetani 12124569]